jgi:hypothetical protein
MKYEGIKTAEDLAEITRKMIEISYAQYGAAMRQSGAMGQAKTLMNPPPPATVTGPQWSLDRAEMGAVEFARIMRNEIASMAKAEQTIADAREMAAIDFARMMRGEGAAAPGLTAEGARGGFLGVEVLSAQARLAALRPAAYDPFANAAVVPSGEGDLGPLSGILGSLAGALGPIIQSFTSFNPVMEAMTIIINSAMSILKPVIDTVLQPLIGIFVILGTTLGQILVPVIKMLTPVIEALGKGFIWLYNNVIMPVGNFLWTSFTIMGNVIANFCKVIVYFATHPITEWGRPFGTGGGVNAGGGPPTVMGGTGVGYVPEDLGFLPTDVAGIGASPLSPIDMAALAAAGAGYQNSQGGGVGSNTTVQHPPDIYIYQTFEGPIVGAGGSREFAQFVIDAIKDYLGTGARVTFLEA